MNTEKNAFEDEMEEDEVSESVGAWQDKMRFIEKNEDRMSNRLKKFKPKNINKHNDEQK